MDSLIGQQLANFRIERPLGRGGMAQVYYGQDVKLNRPVAIKLIDARHRENPSYAERFVREAQAVAKWHHEHIVQIYYADDQDGLYYFVMEYVDGQDLESILTAHRAKKELMPHEEVLHVAEALAEALDYAHEQGVIHRDVKPANLMVAKDGRVILMDFGLAMDVEQGSIGEVFGSTKYIAPEQARRSSDAVPQSDIYALGVILYEILTDHLPFDDPSPTALAIQHLTMEPPRPREFNPKLNAETEAVLLKALQKSPDQRYQTGVELMEALKHALAGSTEILPLKQTAATPTSPTINPDNLMGQLLDEYKLERLLGQGGMARVYLGVDVNLDRRVAIKVIDTPYRDDETYEMRFKREAKAIAQLEHPQIVRLYRYGKANGLLYMAMQFIEGQTLQAKLAHYRDKNDYMPFAEVQRIITDVCDALDYAHSKSVIHRDIKPSNIMLNEAEEVFLADFGLALLQDVGTRGEVLGSPHYIAPEQAISSAGVVPQSDLYAVGVILFYMLTNSLPFDAAEPLDIAMLHMSEPPPAPRSLRPNLSSELEGVVLKTLAKKPTERYASGAELVSALTQALPQSESSTVAATPILPLENQSAPAPVAPIAVVAATPTPSQTPKPTTAAMPTLPPIPAVMAARQDNQTTAKTPSILTKLNETSSAHHSVLSVSRLKDRQSRPYIAAAIVILLLLCGVAYMMFGTGQTAEIVATTPTVTATLNPTATTIPTEMAAAFEPPTATIAIVAVLTITSTPTLTPTEIAATATLTPTEVAATATLTPTEIPATPTVAANDQNKLGYLALWQSVVTGTITARGEKWFTFDSGEATNGAIIVFIRNGDWLKMTIYDGSQIPRWPPTKPDEIAHVGFGTDTDLDGNPQNKEIIWEGNFIPNSVIFVRLTNELNKTVSYCVATRKDAKRCP